MKAATEERGVALRKLSWVGPATVAGAVVVVRLLQIVAMAILNPSGRSLLRTEEPASVPPENMMAVLPRST